MIYYFTPYDSGGNVGKAYNEHIRLVPLEDDFIALTDRDAMFLTADYGKQIEDVIKMYPGTGIFTAYCNRVGNVHQRYNGVISENHSWKYHIDLALQLQKENYLGIKQINRSISGFLMIFQKKTWQSVGGFSEKGMIAIDNDFSRKVLALGKNILLMEGVYMFHYYRLLEGGRKYKLHLQK